MEPRKTHRVCSPGRLSKDLPHRRRSIGDYHREIRRIGFCAESSIDLQAYTDRGYVARKGR